MESCFHSGNKSTYYAKRVIFLKGCWSQYNAIHFLSIVKVPKYTVDETRIKVHPVQNTMKNKLRKRNQGGKVHFVLRIKPGGNHFLLLSTNEQQDFGNIYFAKRI